ncbi:MAG: CapA family protein [Oscillospiraceae bacterium]|nr:CapA family protein [Oscillospiraceae bacterium]
MQTKPDRKYAIFFAALIVAVLAMFAFFSMRDSDKNNGAKPPETETPSNISNILDNYISTERTEQTELPEITDITEITDTAESENIPEPEEKEIRIRFTGTGDNVVHECLWMDAQRRALPDGREYNFKPMFADAADIIASADIAFINQETPMAGSDYALAGYPLFNSPQDLGHDLAELGFDVINIANNHMLDKGEKGLVNTIDFLRSLPPLVIGDYLNRDELYDIKIIERNGIKTAFLAYTYSTNGLALPAGSEVIIPYIDDGLIVSQIEKAKEISDAVIVSVHWGEEDSFNPTTNQKRLAQLMADHGVLAIIGHHPHVLQPVEWLEGIGGNKTLCVYSLGNLASGMIRPMNMVGGFISFDIVKRIETGENQNRIIIENPVFTPTIYYYGSGWLNGHVYLLKDYTPELAKSHGTFTRHGYSRTVEDLWGYVTRNISGEFLE